MGWCNQTRAANVAKDQLLGEDQFANLQRQVQLDDAIVVQSHLVSLGPGISSRSQETDLSPSQKSHKVKGKPTLMFCED